MSMGTWSFLAAAIIGSIGLAACGPSSDMKGIDKSMSKMDIKDKTPAPAPKQDAVPADRMAKSDMKGMDNSEMKMDSKAGSHTATASVKSVDANAQTVTLDHGPVASMNWPAMTMSFKVKDKAMLDKLAVGKKVEVDFVQQGGDYIITDVK